MKALFKFLPLLFLFILLFVSCSGEKKNKDRTTPKEILLSDLIIEEELNISYQVPQNWDEMPASSTEKMVARTDKKGENEFIVYTPKSFYFNNVNNSLLRVGQIKFKNNSSSTSLEIDKYVNLFKKYNKDLEIESSNIENNNFHIVQIKITKNNLMSFKFLFKNYRKEIIQFDFSIKTENYSKIHPLIIASINSIKLL